MFAYANVGLALNGELPSGMLGYGAGLALLGGVAHLVVRRFAKYADPLLLPLATLLNGLGLALDPRLDQSERLLAHPSFAPAASKQLIFSAMGLCSSWERCSLKDHRILQRYTYISMVVPLVLLILPMFFPAQFGAKIWITIPGSDPSSPVSSRRSSSRCSSPAT
ncbi:Cell division protein FtsW OS=Streptomyces microflavus OX=1919 GN=G3I39_24325 PE=4 SV=1 [Streptomyces microflavus]